MVSVVFFSRDFQDAMLRIKNKIALRNEKYLYELVICGILLGIFQFVEVLECDTIEKYGELYLIMSAMVTQQCYIFKANIKFMYLLVKLYYDE